MPKAVTVIDEVAAPVFQSKLPVAAVLKVELPQLLATVTTGVGGIVFGAEVPVPFELLQPLTVVVTL